MAPHLTLEQKWASPVCMLLGSVSVLNLTAKTFVSVERTLCTENDPIPVPGHKTVTHE